MLRTLTPDEAASFPYPKPWGALPWQSITTQADLPLDEWVWVADRQHNIWPAARTARGLEVPGYLDLRARAKAGLLKKPIYWLPFTPDAVVVLIGQRLPGLLRRGRPNHG